jgi:maleate isomerase
MNIDVLGWRKKFGVLGPSTNTIVQPEFDAMRPDGVTNHYSRILTPNAKAISNEAFMAGSMKIAEGVIAAVESVLTCEPDYLVMGMSAITFFGGLAGSKAFTQKVNAVSGLGVSTGAEATAAALRTFPGVKTVSFLSPYYPVANTEVRRFYTESGFEVIDDICLQCPSWTAIAKVPSALLRGKLLELAAGKADAIVQVGTNLCMAELAGEMEVTIGRPVIAINTATYWHALRHCGIKDRITGFGQLLEAY